MAKATLPPSREQTRAQPHPGRRPTHVARVLVVEDEPVTAEVFARTLRKNGYEVCIACDGLQALRVLRDKQPDLMVLDLGLPTLPGIEVLRRLRNSDEPNLPVIVVSGAPARALPNAAPLVQPGVWLEKPLRPNDLLSAIRKLS
ncbi:MAG: response regulator [Planctomycetota bacterium]|nr:response regulator [Planctomycetota bacterium]